MRQRLITLCWLVDKRQQGSRALLYIQNVYGFIGFPSIWVFPVIREHSPHE